MGSNLLQQPVQTLRTMRNRVDVIASVPSGSHGAGVRVS